ncbi:MAG: AAA family ATPase [Oscillospiraceae bacterium]|jgi:energy-coupling factor transporter ATP-binding protein EcfA2|nr:AAA family ATPase [Oscillospiraceae bacterium]
MINAITRVEITDFLVFKDKFAVDFCPGINVLVGVNGSGKTTLMKVMYAACDGKETRSGRESINKYLPQYFGTAAFVGESEVEIKYADGQTIRWLLKHPEIDKEETSPDDTTVSVKPVSFKGRVALDFSSGMTIQHPTVPDAVYMPEKDILEHAKGLLPFIQKKEAGFSDIYKNILIAAQDVPTKEQTVTQKLIGQKLAGIVGGYVEWVPGDGTFYMVKTDGKRIPFSHEASGFKKLGFLGLMVASGQLDPGSVFFWDEPENSLNPELVPKLVDVLLELSRNDVQIFIATHSELLANEFNVSRHENDIVEYFSLLRCEDGTIDANTDTRFDMLEPNKLTQAAVEQYEREIEKGLGGVMEESRKKVSGNLHGGANVSRAEAPAALFS